MRSLRTDFGIGTAPISSWNVKQNAPCSINTIFLIIFWRDVCIRWSMLEAISHFCTNQITEYNLWNGFVVFFGNGSQFFIIQKCRLLFSWNWSGRKVESKLLVKRSSKQQMVLKWSWLPSKWTVGCHNNISVVTEFSQLTLVYLRWCFNLPKKTRFWVLSKKCYDLWNVWWDDCDIYSKLEENFKKSKGNSQEYRGNLSEC